MRLSHRELRAMSHPLRRMLQRRVELPTMERLGLEVRGRDVLEIGCGSGYGAELLLRDEPQSYLGVDLMEEQIEMALGRGLEGADFAVADATDLSAVPDTSMDVVVVFGILHHVPAWRAVVTECHRVLRPGGALVIEEPEGSAIALWDRLFHWGHPTEGLFSLSELAEELRSTGFVIERRLHLGVFAFYAARRDGLAIGAASEGDAGQAGVGVEP